MLMQEGVRARVIPLVCCFLLLLSMAACTARAARECRKLSKWGSPGKLVPGAAAAAAGRTHRQGAQLRP